MSLLEDFEKEKFVVFNRISFDNVYIYIYIYIGEHCAT